VIGLKPVQDQNELHIVGLLFHAVYMCVN